MYRSYNWKLVAIVLSLGVFLLAVQAPAADAQPQRTVDIVAKRFAFSPNQITLKKGETVKLVVHSEDVTHGFFMRALKIDEEIEAGQSKELVITPKVAGAFTTICHHFCGANHGNMKMTIVVE